MTDLLDIRADDAVLEIGTGLGYQAAILSQLTRKVYSIEIIEELNARRSYDSVNRATPMLRSRLPMAIMVGPSTPRSIR